MDFSASQTARGGGSAWTPNALAPLLWMYASPATLRLTAAGEVEDLLDRSPAKNDLQQLGVGVHPEVIDNWRRGKPAIYFSATSGGPFLPAKDTTGTLITVPSGTDRPFSALITLQLELPTVDQVILNWDHSSGGNAQSIVRVDNAGGGCLRYARTDDASAAANVTGTVVLGGGVRRLGVIFTGTTASLLVDSVLDVNNAACDVGASTYNRWRIGTGPGIDALTAPCPECVIVPRAISLAEWAQYYQYSLGQWGV